MPRSGPLPTRPPAIATSVLLAVLLAICTTAVGGLQAYASPTASAAHTCSAPRYPGLGYFTSLTVSNASCSTGVKVALGFYRCRLRGGGLKGYCHGKVYGFTCHELRNSIPTEIDARVTCRLNRATVIHTYQQNT